MRKFGSGPGTKSKVRPKIFFAHSGTARGDDAMASMTNLRILYRMYIQRSKIHYNLDSKVISFYFIFLFFYFLKIIFML